MSFTGVNRDRKANAVQALLLIGDGPYIIIITTECVVSN